MFRSNLRKTITRAMVLIVLALGGVVAAQAPAAAAWSDCPPGTGCIWTGILGGGNKLVFPVSTYGVGGCANLHTPQNFPSWAPDNTESVRAGYGSGLRLQLWEHWNCTGLSRTIASVNNESWGYHILLMNDVSAVKILYP